MARYIGPVCKLCRREQTKLFLKGDRCWSEKCAIERQKPPPGMQSLRRRGTISEYGIQLREKQKLRRSYGILERQFHRHYRDAERSPGITGEKLLQILQRRLDNVVYRTGFATSRAQARQLVNHGHFQVNGKKMSIPSFLLDVGDVVSVKERSRKMLPIVEAVEATKLRGMPAWISVDPEKLEGKIDRLPERQDIGYDIRDQLIVEFYSR